MDEAARHKQGFGSSVQLLMLRVATNRQSTGLDPGGGVRGVGVQAGGDWEKGMKRETWRNLRSLLMCKRALFKWP